MNTLNRLALLVFPALLFLVPFSAAAALSPEDQTAIGSRISTIIDGINTGNTAAIDAMIAPDARPDLRHQIDDTVAGKMVNFQEQISAYQQMADGRVQVTGIYAFKTPNAEVSGLSNSFVFEKSEGQWLLADTDFYANMSPGKIFLFLGGILAIVLPIGFLAVAFWLWMVVDVLSHPIPNKALWAVLVIILGDIGALVYFFTARRQYRRAMVAPAVSV